MRTRSFSAAVSRDGARSFERQRQRDSRALFSLCGRRRRRARLESALFSFMLASRACACACFAKETRALGYGTPRRRRRRCSRRRRRPPPGPPRTSRSRRRSSCGLRGPRTNQSDHTSRTRGTRTCVCQHTGFQKSLARRTLESRERENARARSGASLERLFSSSPQDSVFARVDGGVCQQQALVEVERCGGGGGGVERTRRVDLHAPNVRFRRTARDIQLRSPTLPVSSVFFRFLWFLILPVRIIRILSTRASSSSSSSFSSSAGFCFCLPLLLPLLLLLFLHIIPISLHLLLIVLLLCLLILLLLLLLLLPRRLRERERESPQANSLCKSTL